MQTEPLPEKRRKGDTLQISGDYQYRALHEGNAVQRFWHHNKQLAIEEILPPAASDFVLDVGCGSGVISDYLGQSGTRVLGVDGNAEAVGFARSRFERENVKFLNGLVDEELKLDAPVDKIYCLELIEHIYYAQGLQMLGSFHKLLKSGGQVFLTTPNYRSLWPVIEWVMDRTGAAPEMGEHQHVEHYHRGKLEQLAFEAGFEVESIRSMSFMAPWLAPLSWKLALQAHKLEIRRGGGMGSILIARLRKN